MQIGTYNTLIIDRVTNVGLFLTNGKDDVLLPNKYIPEAYKIGDEIEVFIYLDQQERPVATTLKPYITLNKFGWLRVNYINQIGAFLDWGLEKDIFVPFKEQARAMEQGKRYLVYLYLDEKTNRLVGSSKINQFLNQENCTLGVNDEVDLIISHITDLGINVIINEKFKGLVYQSQVFKDLKPGQTTTGFIKNIRPDGKIDVILQKEGFDAIEPNAKIILDELQSGRGFLRLNDSSNPEDIKTILQMSKKNFKKAIGLLYKQKLIEIKDEGIYLVK